MHSLTCQRPWGFSAAGLACFVPLLLVAMVVTGSHAVAQGAEPPPPQSAAGATDPIDAELAARGLELYRAHYCGICHAFEAAASRGSFGPPHDGLAAIATARIRADDYYGAATTAAEYLRESIVMPDAYIVSGYAATPHAMPAFTSLSEEELDALVAFLMQP